MTRELYDRLPRIYVDQALHEHSTISLNESQAHYFKNVLRKNTGDTIRIFNAKNGEWHAELREIKKKSATAICIKRLKPPPAAIGKTHLIFAPIKKTRMDMLTEKAVELGVTDLHPTITAFTQHGKIKTERINAQIIEAAEQCERMDIPNLHPIKPLAHVIQNWSASDNILWANERGKDSPISKQSIDNTCTFLIGPEGGFSDEEIETLNAQSIIKPISLGERIYRAETAAMLCLAHSALQRLK